jgi:hypothetical protein
MHTLRMTIIGLLLLGVFVLGARLRNRSQDRRTDGAWIFIWVWLVVALANLMVGVFVAGIPLLTEILVLIVVFGIPAAAAWYLSRRFAGSSAP